MEILQNLFNNIMAFFDSTYLYVLSLAGIAGIAIGLIVNKDNKTNPCEHCFFGIIKLAKTDRPYYSYRYKHCYVPDNVDKPSIISVKEKKERD
mgnify:CR=1 FL=1